MTSNEDANNQMGPSSASPNQAARTDDFIQRNSSFLAVLDIGYNREDVLRVAREAINDSEIPLSTENLVNRLIDENKWPGGCEYHNGNSEHPTESDELSCQEMLEDHRRRNRGLRDKVTCKVCRLEGVSRLFLPCGHLVCCATCAVGRQTCYLCQGQVTSVHTVQFSLS